MNDADSERGLNALFKLLKPVHREHLLSMLHRGSDSLVPDIVDILVRLKLAKRIQNSVALTREGRIIAEWCARREC